MAVIARRLEGKVALITGGASGIGECTARLFIRNGAKVVVADIQDKLGNTVCNDIGPAASFIRCDVTNEGDISKAVNHAVTKFGKLDIMFNNAGIAGAAHPRILDNKKEDVEKVIAINLVGPFLGTKHAARVMIPARQGCIINTASVAGSIGGAASHGYTSAKHGVVGLTKNSAVELGRFGIRVNCVSPSGVATPLSTGVFEISDEQVEAMVDAVSTLKGVTLKKEDVANAVLFLASDEAKCVSGQNLAIDGGYGIVNSSFDLFKVDGT